MTLPNFAAADRRDAEELSKLGDLLDGLDKGSEKGGLVKTIFAFYSAASSVALPPFSEDCIIRYLVCSTTTATSIYLQKDNAAVPSVTGIKTNIIGVAGPSFACPLNVKIAAGTTLWMVSSAACNALLIFESF